MLRKGSKIGDYILLEPLGSGGFGDVWKAEKRTSLDVNHFALKFFRPKEDGVDFEKVNRELAVWKQLRGLPYIISMIELDRFEDYVYVVSDYAEGGSLEKWIRANGGKAPSVDVAVRIMTEILAGLENLHDRRFVHRDLKPDNILIMNGKYCLADFGISREIKSHSKATGTAGTMEYMPPEAFENEPSVTPATDVWAVGVILQRLLTGRFPFPETDVPSLIRSILMNEPAGPGPEVPEWLRLIIERALRKDRNERFASAHEMRAALTNRNIVTEVPENRSSSTIVDEEFDKPQPRQDSLPATVAYHGQNQPESIERPRVDRRQAEVPRPTAPPQESVPDFLAHSEKPKWKGWQRWAFVGGLTTVVLIVFALLAVLAAFLASGSGNSALKNVKTGNQPVNQFENAPTNVARANDQPLANSANSQQSPQNSKTNSIGMELVWVKPGEFMMGSDELNDEKPAHKVTFREGFWMGKFEVTQEEWESVMESNPSNFKNCGGKCPVERVSWDDIQDFLNRLNAKNDGFTYDLPSEAQWEYAARAGTTGDYYGNVNEIAWYLDNSNDTTHPVGQKKPNAFGLYDTSGNVWEWVKDIYTPNGYAGLPTDGSANMSVGDSKVRVLRGGSWSYVADYARSANRSRDASTLRNGNCGFRVAARPR